MRREESGGADKKPSGTAVVGAERTGLRDPGPASRFPTEIRD